jgi:hypothetical protein
MMEVQNKKAKNSNFGCLALFWVFYQLSHTASLTYAF